MTVQTLTRELARSLEVESQEGVIVTQVEPGSLASDARIRRGDIIESVDNKPVTSARQFNELLESSNLDSGVRLRVVRNGFGRFEILKNRD